MAEPEPRPDEPPRPTARPTSADLLGPLLEAVGRRSAAVVAGVLLVAGTSVAGYALLRTPPAPDTEALLPYAPGAGGQPAAPIPTTSTTAPPELVVHAAGAVVAPGVLRLPTGSRVEDLLAAAGGPSPDADVDRVNLAAPLADGQRVWIPRVGEATPPEVPGDAPGPPGAGGEAEGPVDLNTATAEQLDTLPGVGPATAAAIIEHRERQGPFRSVEDLLDVPGIGDAKLAQLRDLVSV
jgi:competence protein ComEA